MKLYELLPECHQHPLKELEIGCFQSVSSAIQPGDVFVALPGARQHGLAFADEALTRGACLVLTPSLESYPAHPKIIAVDHLKERLSFLMTTLYGLDVEPWRAVAITGTNGKTSCCHFIASGLRSLERSVGTVGTLGWGIRPGVFESTGHTTPDLTSLYGIIKRMQQSSVESLVMEVSSHALSQQRVQGIPFEVALFTNVTRDHLDYHGSWEDYAQTKASLLDVPALKTAIFNADDPCLVRLSQENRGRYGILTYSLEDSSASIVAKDIHYFRHGTQARVHTPAGYFDIDIPLVGAFNLSNTLGAIAVWYAQDYSLDLIIKMVRSLEAVPGRMQLVQSHSQSAAIYIDYAHTPDALEKVLLALRPLTDSRVICVMGCGGNRDQGKRILMGQVADSLADVVIITNDNPRDEDPMSIAKTILSGINRPDNVFLNLNRARAIEQAIALAEDRDIVLIAGKGHETEQIEAGKTTYFSDLACVEAYICSD